MTKTQLTKMTNPELRAFALKTNPQAKVPKKWKDKKTAVAAVTKIIKAAKHDENKGTKKKKPTITKKVVTKKVVSKKVTDKVKGTKMGTAAERRQTLVTILRKSAKTVRELAAELNVKPKNITNDLHTLRHNMGDYIENDETIKSEFIKKAKVFSIVTEK